MGRFVSIVGLKDLPKSSEFPMEKLGEQLCQHIIGMNPQTLGSEIVQKETESTKHKTKLNEPKKESTKLQNDDDLNAFSDVKVKFYKILLIFLLLKN